MPNLHAASSEWASRPADERFWTLETMRLACRSSREGSAVATIATSDLRATVADGNLALVGRTGADAALTHHAFGQLATLAGAPAAYIRTLPAALAAECMNTGLANVDRADRNILFHRNGRLTARAILSDRYDRVWDDDVCSFLQRLDGWRAPAGRHIAGDSRRATADDILPGQINIHVGDEIGPAGLYASDHDMFAFLVAPDRVIDDSNGGALMRGIFVRNSEVGDASLTMTCFLMQAVCGNHIVWNATGVHDVRFRHIGAQTMVRGFREFEATLRRYHDAAPEEEAMIASARRLVLGNTKDEVLDALVKYAKTHSILLSRSKLSEGYDVAESHAAWYGNPRTVWGVVAGLTHASQGQFADERNVTDRAAGKLLRMAF